MINLIKCVETLKKLTETFCIEYLICTKVVFLLFNINTMHTQSAHHADQIKNRLWHEVKWKVRKKLFSNFDI